MFFVAKICKRALRASIEGYLAVAASTPTYSSLADVGKPNQCTLLWFTLSAFPNFTAHPDASAGEIKIGGDQAALSLLRKETKMRLLLLLVWLL